MKKDIIIFAIAIGTIFVGIQLLDQPVKYGPGILVNSVPEQHELTEDSIQPFIIDKQYTIRPIAEFSLKAKVLGKESYYFDTESDLVKYDLALGWLEMSDEEVLSEIDISQSGRFFYWHTDKFPVPRKKIEHNSANMHLIPANDDIEDAISDVREGEIIKLEGYLVRVSKSGGWKWNSSLSRNDTGDGACELIWVESFSTVDNPFEDVDL
jgi:hypothetical protein